MESAIFSVGAGWPEICWEFVTLLDNVYLAKIIQFYEYEE
jgi:hypothetical protein